MASGFKVTFDFSDRPELIEGLRILAAREGSSQRKIVAEALEAYFAQRQENSLLLDAANRVFSEWENAEDRVHDSL